MQKKNIFLNPLEIGGFCIKSYLAGGDISIKTLIICFDVGNDKFHKHRGR